MNQINAMPTVKKIVRASELPRDWQREFADPGQIVSVTITDVDPQLDEAGSLSEVMDVIGKRAEKRGLTEKILKDILHE